jgi:hypothetical protein
MKRFSSLQAGRLPSCPLGRRTPRQASPLLKGQQAATSWRALPRPPMHLLQAHNAARALGKLSPVLQRPGTARQATAAARMLTQCHTRFLRPKPDAHRMHAQDQFVIHTVRM